MSKRFALLLTVILLISSYSPLLAQEEHKLKVYAENGEKSVKIYADNPQLYPQTVKLELTLKGVKPKEEVPKYQVVPAGSKKLLLTELVPPAARSWSYRYKYLYFMGDINTEHDDDFVYRLPYASGTTHKVGQGYNGAQSHRGENALDFVMDEGTSVMASRAGLVVEIKKDSNYGCAEKGCADFGNYVRILHDDGTFADYYHLQQNGALVEPGDQVEAGQEIGKSGNTGWTTGPHLHFIVYKRGEKKRISFETLFRTRRSSGVLLKEKKFYKAVD